MGPGIIVLVLAGVGGWLLLKPTTEAPKKSSEAPADADGLLANALAPSLTDLPTLLQIYTYLAAAFKNATGTSAQRLALYALTVFLKACMLARGAAPDANELAAIARAPLAGGAGLISYGDAGADQMAAAVAALAATMTDVGALGTYITAIANVSGGKNKRLTAYLLALKAKQMALRNTVRFPDAEGLAKYEPETFFAIANLAASNVPTPGANSILAF